MPFQICVTEIPEREKKKKTVFLKDFSKISQWYKAHVWETANPKGHKEKKNYTKEH